MDVAFKFQKMDSDQQNFKAFKAPQEDPPAVLEKKQAKVYVFLKL